MTVTVHEPVPMGSRVEVIAGDLQGEPGTVVDWEFRSSSRLTLVDGERERLYWVEIDGDPACVPFLRGQLLVADENEAWL